MTKTAMSILKPSAIMAALLLSALFPAGAWSEVEITGFKVKTLGRNNLQQVMIVSFHIEYRGGCGNIVIEAEALGPEGQEVSTAKITGECAGSKGLFTAQMPVPFEKYDRITSWRIKSVSATTAPLK